MLGFGSRVRTVSFFLKRHHIYTRELRVGIQAARQAFDKLTVPHPVLEQDNQRSPWLLLLLEPRTQAAHSSGTGILSLNMQSFKEMFPQLGLKSENAGKKGSWEFSHSFRTSNTNCKNHDMAQQFHSVKCQRAAPGSLSHTLPRCHWSRYSSQTGSVASAPTGVLQTLQRKVNSSTLSF